MNDGERLQRYAQLAVEVGANLQPGQLLLVQAYPRAGGAGAGGRRRRLQGGCPLRRRQLRRPARAPLADRERARGDALLVAALAGRSPRVRARSRRPPRSPSPAIPSRACSPTSIPARVAASRQRELMEASLQPARRGARRLDADRRPDRGLGPGDLRRARRRAPLAGDRAHGQAGRARPGRRLAASTSPGSRSGPSCSTSAASTGSSSAARAPTSAIGLLPDSNWHAAEGETIFGQRYVPNIPTEEVFATPDRLRAEGHVRSTKPLSLDGTIARDLELRLRGRAHRQGLGLERPGGGRGADPHRRERLPPGRGLDRRPHLARRRPGHDLREHALR